MKTPSVAIAASLAGALIMGASAVLMIPDRIPDLLNGPIALKADEGVPHNLVTALNADEGVPHNLVTTSAAA